MNEKRKERLIIAFFFGILGMGLGLITEKWGIGRGRPPYTISWIEFFSERLDNVLIMSLLAFGAGYLISGTLGHDSEHLICPRCQTPYNNNDVTHQACPKCLVKLEPIKGFYKRHPEFKE